MQLKAQFQIIWSACWWLCLPSVNNSLSDKLLMPLRYSVCILKNVIKNNCYIMQYSKSVLPIFVIIDSKQHSLWATGHIHMYLHIQAHAHMKISANDGFIVKTLLNHKQTIHSHQRQWNHNNNIMQKHTSAICWHHYEQQETKKHCFFACLIKKHNT